MVERNVTVNLPQGLHARPAGLFVKKASTFRSEIRLGKDGKYINAKSILGLMSMAVAKGQEVSLVAEGTDEEEVVNALAEMLARSED